ncbi:MAG: hypothetical protein QNJ54_18550 [Prochloraceae cyanobacterium]|nr:hypothetical protein [Prochloraceae cyanobacterium]
MSSTKMVRKSITLPEDLAKKIEKLSTVERRSFSAQIAIFAEYFFKSQKKEENN